MKAYQKYVLEANASLENTWEVLVNPDLVQQYMYGTRPESGWKPGDSVRWSMDIDGAEQTFVHGVIKEYKKPEKLVYTIFPTQSDIEDIPENHLVVVNTLEDLGNNRTRLTFDIGDFSKVAKGEKRYQDSETGWNDILNKIMALAESQESKNK